MTAIANVPRRLRDFLNLHCSLIWAVHRRVNIECSRPLRHRYGNRVTQVLSAVSIHDVPQEEYVDHSSAGEDDLMDNDYHALRTKTGTCGKFGSLGGLWASSNC